MDDRAINRRRFIKRAAGTAAGAVGFPYLVSSSALGNAGSVAASERITVGCVGVGPQGTGVMGNFLGQKDAHVVAICDVKSTRRDAVQKIVNDHYKAEGCKTYKDFREMMARDDIDVILSATCDHWHTPVAKESGKKEKEA